MFFSNNLVGDYETGFVFRSLMARGKKLLLSLSVFELSERSGIFRKALSAPKEISFRSHTLQQANAIIVLDNL